MSRVFRFVMLSAFLLVTLPVYAQTTGADPFTVDLGPQYPTPYQTVTVTPSSSIFDINSASISVTVNGAAFYKGTGGIGISVPVGGPGSITNISVTAVSGGKSYNKRFSVRPADVALVLEPISTTHPFYAGASLVPSEGIVRIVAIPDLRTTSGKILDPASLEYTWKLGDQTLDSDSGIGQNVLSATAPQRYRDATVSLTVQSQDGSVVAQAQTVVSPVDPVSQIYEDDPLLGPLYDNALANSFTMSGTEDTFLGIPYYFSNAPTLDWVMNGSDSGSEGDITVRSSGSGNGTAVLNFSANSVNTVQTANSTVSVSFGQKKSLGIFGL